MPRPTRVQTAGLIRHVMARGNGRMPIFLDDLDYRRFIRGFGDVLEEFGIDCWNYCVMPNHYHATLEPRASNLSEAIRCLNSAYALWWNRRHDRVGHVFQGRFKDQIVERDDYLLTLSRYVLMNPVRAGLVERPEDWPWSSYRATAGLTSEKSLLAGLSTLQLFGNGEDATLRTRFREYVLTHPTDEQATDRLRSNELIVGSRLFKVSVLAGHASPRSAIPA